MVATVATAHPEDAWRDYQKTFKALGVRKLAHLHVPNRNAAHDEAVAGIVDDARVIFFTGGDQVRITSVIGGTPLCDHLMRCFKRGTTVVGTVPVRVTVRNVTLPSTSSLDSVFVNEPTKQCQVHTGSGTCNGNVDEANRLSAVYERVALENRITISTPWQIDRGAALTGAMQTSWRRQVLPIINGATAPASVGSPIGSPHQTVRRSQFSGPRRLPEQTTITSCSLPPVRNIWCRGRCARG